MTAAEISKMSMLERVQMMEALWASFEDSPVDREFPSWHEPVLAERKELITSGNARFLPLSELKMASS